MITSYTTPEIEVDLNLSITMPLRDWRKLQSVCKGSTNLSSLSIVISEMIQAFDKKAQTLLKDWK